MFKLYALTVMSLFIAVTAKAQSGDLALFDEKDETSQSVETPKKDDALFNFMGIKIPNISFSSSTQEDNSVATITRRAENGDVAAQLQLGYAYLYGQEGLKIDYEKAFYFYELAANQNDPIGLNNLATLYYNGVGVKRSPKKAAEIFIKASKLGNADAATNLGFMYLSGNGIEKDIAKGQQYLEQAASKGNVLAGFMTGYAYYKGFNRQINYHIAAPLIKKAADEGLDEAQLTIADMYIKGQGYPRNYNIAVKYLLKAYKQGNVEAMLLLGEIYSGKTKYPADLSVAYVMYSLASVRGVTTAYEKLQILESKLEADKVAQAQNETSQYSEQISQLTAYVRQTYGANLRHFLR